MQSFLFATGIEGSYPVVTGRNGGSLRIDEMEKTGHYRHWKEDLTLVSTLGIDALRYGPPYYKVHQGPGSYDWDFTDEVFAEIRQRGIKPIVDLCHFGLPDWLGNFQNPEFPQFFTEYAEAFARRYPWVELYTPINEIYITAKFSAHEGLWNERMKTDRAFVNAIRNLARANILATEAIMHVQPNAKFIQSESSEYFHPSGPEAMEMARHMNELRFLALDLTYGHDVSGRMYEYLFDNGMKREDYHFFLNRNVKPVCIMGNDYYATNEHVIHPDGSTGSCELFGYYVITQQYYHRYRIPVMHTETNNRDAGTGEKDACAWLEKQWSNLVRLKTDGVPILGFTWYSLVDQVDWDSALTIDAGTVNQYGLCDLERRVRPIGEAYRDLIHTWRHRVRNDFICLH
ncbi:MULTISPECIES: family 1 glycosylhydrolase [unclassified Massilia]|uniref:family 1 glycosylhydrolase n=1 Tax=unclassified Massilia TaxID=2609279 RepID=UPI001B8155AE|nr:MULTISPECIES: family 1 glycosylhydrolase [unclassified Massilia]MBQ5939312.1 glycoside hydrolase family 1 protein [Massilia sp. AB1]MBQ5961392.1 glycoside hydrolase family 1 protein [Massilia sp. ZL223]